MIEVRNLTKKYGDRAVVSDLSFAVKKGSICGLLGPNGAGKTTIMEMIAGCIEATAGEILIDGHSFSEGSLQAKYLIGYLPEQPPLYRDMTPAEYLRFAASAKGIPHAGLLMEINRVMETAGIKSLQEQMIRNLSRVDRQRIGIAQALLGDPMVVLLDEPTAGLEPVQAVEIRTLIKTMGKNHTMILASSDPAEVMTVCDTMMLITSGKLVVSDTPNHLTELSAGAATLALEVKAAEEAVRAVLESVQQIEDMAIKTKEGGVIIANIKPEEDADIREVVFTAFAEAGLPLREMRSKKSGPEELLLRLMQADNEPFSEQTRTKESAL